MNTNRRDFIKSSSAAAAAATVAAGALTSTASAANSVSPNAKMRIGFIGPGGRGFHAHVKTLSKLAVEGQPIELVAVCDVYNKHADQAAEYIKDKTGVDPTIVTLTTPR